MILRYLNRDIFNKSGEVKHVEKLERVQKDLKGIESIHLIEDLSTSIFLD